MFISAEPHTRTSRELSGDEGSHWYDANGSPHHTVRAASTGELRPTTLRDARKNGWLPSVTTVTKVMANTSLDRWKQQQVIDAAFDYATSGRPLTRETFDQAVRNESQRIMVDARAFGSMFHNAVDEFHRTGFLSDDRAEVAPQFEQYVKWIRDNDVKMIATEFVAVNNSLGYAGQVDALARVNGKLTLLDYKTQRVRTEEGAPATASDVSFYPSWAQQLAAYWYADWDYKPKRRPVIMSVVINSLQPNYPIVKEWSTAEIDQQWKLFKASLNLWKLAKNYDPVKANRNPF